MIALQDILKYLRQGRSIKSIHHELKRHKTIIRQMKELAVRHGWLSPSVPLPDEKQLQFIWQGCYQSMQIPHAHALAAYQDDIQRWVKVEKYSFTVMHQLLAQRGYAGSESTVRRYIYKVFPAAPDIVMRRTHTPGEILEVDFGYIGICWDERTQRRRKTWFFSARWRYSRKAYREIVFDQTEITFFNCHIHAFEYFHGVPEKVVMDNLKAAIIKASLENPLVNRSYRSLAEHYAFQISAAPPYAGNIKGGVESDVKYVKRNFLPRFKENQRQKGRTIWDAAELSRELWAWNDTIVDTHVIQKVGRTPLELFEEESKHLKPLPASRWDRLICKETLVGADWRIQFAKAFYSVPYKYIGKTVLALGNSQMVRIMYDLEEIALHEKAQNPWEYKRKTEHAPLHQEEYLTMTSRGLRKQAERSGPSVLAVADKIFADRAVDGLRPVRGLLRLSDKYTATRLENACRRALDFNSAHYVSVKRILEQGLDLPPESIGSSMPEQKTFRFQRPEGYWDAGPEQ